MDSKNHHCASCTRRGRKCEKRFHSNKEWESLKFAEEKNASELAAAFAAQAQVSAKITRLHKHHQILKQRGQHMLDDDTLAMDRWDEEDPESIPSPSPTFGQQLGAIDLPILTESQMNEVFNQLSPLLLDFFSFIW